MQARIPQIINTTVTKIGNLASWINVGIILLILTDVIARYLFNATKTWVIELEWHLFGLLFLLGMSYALQQDKHIRVDLFYEKYSERNKKIVDTVGHLIFLIPWCIVILITSYKYTANSFYIQEGSPNPNGLPFRYVIKSFIFIGFLLLLLTGIAKIWDHISSLRKERN
ncbi:MAG: TRAP transporter small permease subunit [Saprospiraceae bacterium]|nr:TRAP transporter small permease subunit [Saprospiraceae bacterium]